MSDRQAESRQGAPFQVRLARLATVASRLTEGGTAWHARPRVTVTTCPPGSYRGGLRPAWAWPP